MFYLLKFVLFTFLKTGKCSFKMSFLENGFEKAILGELLLRVGRWASCLENGPSLV